LVKGDGGGVVGGGKMGGGGVGWGGGGERDCKSYYVIYPNPFLGGLYGDKGICELNLQFLLS